MPAPFIIPFDNNPVAVSVKTASYTIPAGKFARVYVEVDSGGIFTIDTVSAVTTDAFGTIDAYNAGATNSLSYTAPAFARAILNVSVGTSGANQFNIAGNVAAGFDGVVSSTVPGKIELGPSQTLSKVNNSNSVSYTGVTIPSNATSRQAEFYLPSGTVISGSGNWRAVVQEYNRIS